MSAPLSAPFEALKITEKLPEALSVPSLSASSVVQARKKVRYVPQGTQSYSNSGPNQISFMVSDGSTYLDPQSAYISGTFKVTKAPSTTQPNEPPNSTYAYLDDGIVSLFTRGRVYINNVLVHDTAEIGKATLMEVYSSVPYGHYKSAGVLNGMYTKFNSDIANSAVSNSLADINEALSGMRKNQPARRATELDAFYARENSFVLPLSHLFQFFRSPKMFPLRNSGVIQITLDIAQSSSAFIYDSPTAPQWELKDLDLRCDVCQIAPQYIAVIDSLCSDPSLPGFRLPVESKQVLIANYEASVSAPSQKTIMLSKSTKNARNLLIASQATSNVNLAAYPSTSTFDQNGFREAYVQIGSMRFPQDPCNGFARAYSLLSDSQGLFANVLSEPIIDYENYTGLSLSNITADSWANEFIFGVSFDRLRNEPIDIDGISTEQIGCGQLQFYLVSQPQNAQTLTAVVEFTQVVHIQANMVKVI